MKRETDWPRYMKARRVGATRTLFYWRPHERDVAAGFALGPESLGPDFAAAAARARLLNEHLDAWEPPHGGIKISRGTWRDTAIVHRSCYVHGVADQCLAAGVDMAAGRFMRHSAITMAMAAGLVCSPSEPSAEPAPASGNITVIDGDTVERGGVRWRLIGLDAPEIHRARCAAERERGILAAARLVGLLHDRGGRLVGDGREKYGRRLGRLMIGWPSTGEDDWAAIAIREGLAVPWDGKGKRMDWCAR